MRRTNRNRSDHRSTALCLITGLLLALALFAGSALAAEAAEANSAEFVVSADGKMLEVTAHLVQQSTYSLVKEGFFQDDALSPKTFALKDTDGNDVEYKVSKSTVSFPEGDYTLTYTQEISDSKVYAKFPVNYAVKIYLPAKYLTGHPVLGTVSKGGIVGPSNKEGFGTMVTYANTRAVDVKFYEQGRDMWLYGFLGIWALVLLIVYARYRSYKNRSLKAGQRDK